MQLSVIWILRLVFVVMIQRQVYSLPKIGNKYVIDLIESLPIINTTIMQSTPGFHTQSQAYYIRNLNQELQLPRSTVRKALNLLDGTREFTLLAIVKQRKRNSGTILSFSKGSKRYLELHLSGRKHQVRLYYQHQDRLLVEDFPYQLDDNHWHQIAMSVSGTHATLYIDCNRIYERVIKPIDWGFRLKGVSLWLGQRNSKYSYFRGTIQDVKLVARPYGYTLQCPYLDTECPTCGQFNALEDKVLEMEKYLTELAEKLKIAEKKISSLESCECMKSCDVNGTQRRDGEDWMRDKCQKCTCRGGVVTCAVECPPLDCLYPVQIEGKCCKKCLRQCFHNGESYEHGVGYTYRSHSRRQNCIRCTCQDGSMECRELDIATICPPLNCTERYQKADECCEVCKGTDYCAQGHKCHSNATCINFDTRYACQCNQGFHGDGITCEEHNECLTGQNDCDKNAECTNTPGSYKCRCKDGYSGDGLNCKAICKEKCLNGGICIAPNVCQCRHGFKGSLCEIDIDECALDLHNCHKNSECINLPGWYYCMCKEGYSSRREDNRYGKLCKDVNECSEGRDTCHRSSRCINRDGAYECSCEGKKRCSQNCVYMGMEYANGTVFKKPGNRCHACTCHSGRVICDSEPCDCTSPAFDRECCPHCVQNAHCVQPDSQLVNHNGEKWIEDCEICECLDGEVDCWKLDCPELSCENTIQLEGECCPRCYNDNPCQRTPRKYENINATCNFNSSTYKHGATWHLSDSQDDCTLCECKAGHICCSFNPVSCRDLEEQQPASIDLASLSQTHFKLDTSGETDSRRTGPAVTDTGQIQVARTDAKDRSVIATSEHSESLSGESNTHKEKRNSESVQQLVSDRTERTASLSDDSVDSSSDSTVTQSTWSNKFSRLLNSTRSRIP